MLGEVEKGDIGDVEERLSDAAGKRRDASKNESEFSKNCCPSFLDGLSKSHGNKNFELLKKTLFCS